MRLTSFALVSLAVLIAGCATPRIDWDSRVGHYTYDQAVLELGPPDRESTLRDGTVVAEWAVGRRPATTLGLGVGTGYSRFGTGVGVGHPIGGGYIRVLRLTFDADGTLAAWQRLSR